MEFFGYRGALLALANLKFEEVETIERRVTARIGDSPQLRNLVLQAERGLRTELALTETGDLLSYGYGLDGFAPGKALPTIGPAQQRLHEGYRAARTKYPRDLRFILNYGQFLLTVADYVGARRQFEAALEVDRNNAQAHLGLGLAAYEVQDFTAALGHFEAAVEADSQDLSAPLNAAICLERLGRQKDAKLFWEKVYLKTPDRDLREWIETTHRREGRVAPSSK